MKIQFPSSGVSATFLLLLVTVLTPSCSYSKEYATQLQNPYTFEILQNAENFFVPAGAYIGVVGNKVIIAGGMTQGDKSTSNIYTFDLSSLNPDLEPLEIDLPYATAFGGLASQEDSIILVGGLNTDGQPTSAVWKIEIKDKSATIESLPDLPEPRSHAGTLVHNSTLYVTGGEGATTNVIWSLELNSTGSGQWKSNEIPIKGSLQNPSLVIQGNGSGDRLYLIGNTGEVYAETASVFEYDPSTHEFSQKTSPPTRLETIGAIPVGVGHIFAFSEIESLKLQPTWLAYSTVTDTWVQSTSSNFFGKPLALLQSGDSILSVVETAKGSIQVLVGKPPAFEQSMHWVDYGMLVVYFGLLIWMGYFFSKKEETTDDYFRGGKRIPGWAAGISILGTRFSAISFMSIPAKTFAVNWLYFMNQFGYMLTAHFTVRYVISFFVKLDVTTAYEYLEKRFGSVVRTIGSIKFVLFDLFRMGALVLLPSMVLAVITGINIYVCIIIIGTISTLYTYLGGIEAVIWTDVIQMGVMTGGTSIAIGLALWGADGNIVQIFQSASSQGKTHMLDFSFDLTIMTFWVFLLAIPGAPNESVSAQYIVQRFISTKSYKDAAQSMYINSFVGPAVIFVFFVLGTSIYMFYQANPGEMNASMRQTDEVMAWFIVQQLPIGISGLMIAAIFAATMSSLDSALSSTSTVFIIDIYKPLKKNLSDDAALRKAKSLTILLGAIGTISAMILAAIEVRSLLDYFLQILFLLGGGLAGIFYLGIFTKKANTPGTVIGFIASATTLIYCKLFTDLSFFAFNGIGVIVCVSVGYLSSYLFADHRRELDGLTVYTLGKK